MAFTGFPVETIHFLLDLQQHKKSPGKWSERLKIPPWIQMLMLH